MKKTKNISSFSAIVLIIASTIGAGIFFKNKELNVIANGNMILILVTWLIAALAMIALGGALLEISSAKGSYGIFSWTKLFTHKIFHKSSINYNKYFFIPITIFALSLYATSNFVIGDNPLLKNGFVILAIAFGFFIWFMAINLISLKLSESIQWLTTLIQMIPLIVIPIMGFINFGNVGAGTIWQKEISPENLPKGLNGINGWIILIAGLPAICFTYDGFYTVGALRDNLKNKRKMGSILIWGLIIITLIYMLITVSFNLGSIDGTHKGIGNMPEWLSLFFDICIACGILGIVNAYTLSSPYQYRILALNDEANDISFLSKLFYKKKFKTITTRQQFFVAWFYLLFITSFYYLVFGMIGIFGFKEQNNWSFEKYGSSGTLYQFVDVLLNFSSLITFIILASIVLGGLINRSKQKTLVVHQKFFKTSAIISSTIFYLGGLYVIIGSIVDMTGYNGADAGSAIIKFLIIFFVVLMSFVPSLVSHHLEKRKIITS